MGKKKLVDLFDHGFVENQYAIPTWPIFSALFVSVLTHPFLLAGYLATTLGGRMYKTLKPVDSGKYEMALSTKRLVV